MASRDSVESVGNFKKTIRLANNNNGTCSVRHRCDIIDDIYDPPLRPIRNGNRMLHHMRVLNGELPTVNRRKLSLKYPIAFIIATIITFCGTCIFFGCLFMALSITRQMFRKAYESDYDMEWFRYLQTFVIILSILMGSLSIILLIFGCLAVGTSKSQIYSGFKSRKGAQIAISVFTSIVYALFLIWVIVTLLLVIPIIGYYMLTRICEEKILQINNHVVLEQEVCIGLNYYGFQFSDSKLNVCSNDLVAFCNHVRYFLHLKYFFSKLFVILQKL